MTFSINFREIVSVLTGDYCSTYVRLLQYLAESTVKVQFPVSRFVAHPQSLLYQSGCLTIKYCDEFGYILGIPNEEVRRALNEFVGHTQGRRACDRT